MTKRLRRLVGRLVAIATRPRYALPSAFLLTVLASVLAMIDEAGWATVALASLIFFGIVQATLKPRRDSLEMRDMARRLEQADRRILSAIEGGRVESFDRERESRAAIVAQIDSGISSVRVETRNSVKSLRTTLWRQTQDIEALLQLYADHESDLPMPSSGGWALNPTALLELTHRVKHEKPHTIVELGVGTSTIWLGRIVRAQGGRVLGIEHDAQYMEDVGRLISLHGLADFVELRHAPLKPLDTLPEHPLWYSSEVFQDLHDIDFLVIDGPPKSTGPNARYPALPVLKENLKDGATIFLDDAHREDEKAAVQRWLSDIDALSQESPLQWPHAVLKLHRPFAG